MYITDISRPKMFRFLEIMYIKDIRKFYHRKETYAYKFDVVQNLYEFFLPNF